MSLTRKGLRPVESQPLIIARLLPGLADERFPARELSRLVECDAGLTLRVVRLVNAPYYGTSGDVGSAARAVVLLGVATVRGIVATAAWRLLHGGGQPAPAGRLARALVSASAVSVVAGVAGHPTGDGFTLGLLHELEAPALAEWRFPDRLVQASAEQSRPPEEITEPLGRVLAAGLAIGAQLLPPAGDGPGDPERALKAVGLGRGWVDRLVRAASAELEGRERLLGVRP